MNRTAKWNQFHEACSQGDLEELKKSLEGNLIYADINLNQGIKDAAQHGHLHLVKYLLTSPELEVHSNIHAANDEALRNAASGGHLDIVQYLLTSPDLEDHAYLHVWDDDVLKKACWSGNLDIVKYLLTSPDLQTHSNIHTTEDMPLRIAAKKGHLNIVKYLVISKELASNPKVDCIEKEECDKSVWKWVKEHKNIQEELKTLNKISGSTTKKKSMRSVL